MSSVMCPCCGFVWDRLDGKYYCPDCGCPVRDGGRRMSEAKWHCSPTRNGSPGGPLHYDIGADDNEKIALVYPSEGGLLETASRARLFVEARETKRQRDGLLNAARACVEVLDRFEEGIDLEGEEPAAGPAIQKANRAIAECEGEE